MDAKVVEPMGANGNNKAERNRQYMLERIAERQLFAPDFSKEREGLGFSGAGVHGPSPG